MSGETLVIWLQFWYGFACALWIAGAAIYGRQYLRAMYGENHRHFHPFLFQAVTSAAIGLAECGFFEWTLLFERRNVHMTRLAITLLPVSITLQALVYILIGFIVTRSTGRDAGN